MLKKNPVNAVKRHSIRESSGFKFRQIHLGQMLENSQKLQGFES